MLIFNTFAGWLRWNCRRLKEYKSINTSQFSFTIPESLFADEMNEIEAKPASSIKTRMMDVLSDGDKKAAKLAFDRNLH
jgi:hypothetical protein